MGTNYYLHEEECECCNHTPDPIHIGKSSVGWAFMLCAIDGVEDKDCLTTWSDRFTSAKYHIKDEYGERVFPTEMYVKIAERKGSKGITKPSTFYDPNTYVDKRLLLHHKAMRGFVKEETPNVTYDVCHGEFS